MIRTAFFPDSYLEVNGVAHTSRRLVDYARRRGLPFLCVHGGDEGSREMEGGLTSLRLKRSWTSFGLDRDLIFDLLYLRHLDQVVAECSRFLPDVVHITGPSDNGILGAMVAHRLSLPLVASWHTNLHEYSGRRMARMMRLLPSPWAEKMAHWAERCSFSACARYYRLGRVLFAPNVELCALLEDRCNRPCQLMPRGVDTEVFSPAFRDVDDGVIRIGYVGRLSAEKNVRFLAEVERALADRGVAGFRFVVIGQGSDEPWLRRNLRNIELPGVLRGPALSRAYANMDIFAFPSHTDTFGNVVLEALASGVPSVVTGGGGPKFIVRDLSNGFVAGSDRAFIQGVARLAQDRELRLQMARQARIQALSMSWDSVFDRVYSGYEAAIRQSRVSAVRLPLRTSSLPGKAKRLTETRSH